LPEAVRRIADLRIGQNPAGSRIGRRLDDLDRGDLLAEDEPGDVHLVNQAVAHHHRAVETRGTAAVAVCTVHHQRLTELTRRSNMAFSAVYSSSMRRMNPT
jgi:hypothetical protein